MRAVLAAAVLVLLAAAPAGAETVTLTQTGDIAIPADGAASPYPSVIQADDLTGSIRDVNVTLSAVDHTFPDDLDILLVGPDGAGARLFADACGTSNLLGTDFTLDQDAAAMLPDDLGGDACPAGTYRPANYPPAGDDPDPSGYIGPFPADLDRFNGKRAYGEWRLFVYDDTAGGPGGDSIDGWSLTLELTDPILAIPTDSLSIGPADPYPFTRDVSGVPGVITDVDVTLRDLFHQSPGDMDILLQGPRGQAVMLLSDACNFATIESFDPLFDDESPLFYDEIEGTGCNGEVARGVPVDYGDQETLPRPAPERPYATSLSVFDSTDPNGTWRVWIDDDTTDGLGWIDAPFELDFETRPGAAVAFANAVTTGAEGSSVSLEVRRGGVPSLGAGSVRVRSAEGTATASDFTPLDTTLDFAPGETVKSVSVPIAAGGDEGEERFSLSLSEFSGDAAPGDPSTATVVIPADAPVALPAFTRANAATLPGTRRCKRRRTRLRLRPREPAGIDIARTQLFVNGKRVANRAGARADDALVVRMRGRRLRVRLRIVAADGRIVVIRRTYRRCRK